MKDKGEKGSFTVEAILSLSIFMFAFVTIVSLATVAKIESTTQYAIDQTAKEISKYTYIASRANLLVHPKDSAEATVDSIDEAQQLHRRQRRDPELRGPERYAQRHERR